MNRHVHLQQDPRDGNRPHPSDALQVFSTRLGERPELSPATRRPASYFRIHRILSSASAAGRTRSHESRPRRFRTWLRCPDKGLRNPGQGRQEESDAIHVRRSKGCKSLTGCSATQPTTPMIRNAMKNTCWMILMFCAVFGLLAGSPLRALFVQPRRWRAHPHPVPNGFPENRGYRGHDVPQLRGWQDGHV